MRLAFVIGIVTLYVTLDSHAVPAPSHGTRPTVSVNERKQSQQFVVDLARNFSSLYFEKLTRYVPAGRILSPLSVFIPISMLTYGSRRSTRKSFLKAIGLSQNQIQMAKTGYMKYLDQLANYDISIKTKLFVPEGVELESYFKSLAKKTFHSEIEAVSVTDGFMDGTKINEWVAVQTHNNVTELFKPEHIGPNPSFVLVNTVYFKGTWKQAFDKSRTKLRPFHPFGGESLNVKTMYTVGHFRYGQLNDFDIHFIELPYKSNSIKNAMSMFILLSKQMTYNPWIEKLPALRNMKLEKLLDSEERKVEVFLPKFKIETTLSLNKWLNNVFASAPPFKEAADFTGMFKSSQRFNFSESVSKVAIEVDEEGHETAESSGISYNSTRTAESSRKTRSTDEQVMQFKVDRPFIAMIVAKGRVLTDIFSISFNGVEFIPDDVTFW
ncbi:serine protease inhibitor 3/4-like [Venturia canescens]|uniref:serine protease inhibitor 3/4-like n=1 Tax=Venturia canescens TaxID=32260 RepID=UPI001C9BBE20|nr:serine protease inhibitor 3/4-like [Venturia canescens]